MVVPLFQVAFLFAFFELYNKALILHFLFGLALLVGGLYTKSHKHIKQVSHIFAAVLL